MSQGLLKLIRKKRRTYKRFKKYPTQENENLYNTCEREVRRQTKRAKKNLKETLLRVETNLKKSSIVI